MSELDRRVKRAFDEVKAPDGVKCQTLSFIEDVRSEAEASEVRPAPRAEDAVSLPRAFRQSAAKASGKRAPRRGLFRARRTRSAFFACAACLALLAMCWGGFRLYAQPTAYVGIDVNPSVELSVNRFGLVVGARGINDDGRELLETVSLANRAYSEALSVLTQSDAFAPYRQESAFIEISVVSDNERQSQDLYAQSTEGLSTLPCEGVCHRVDEQTWRSAGACGMGMGRYRAVSELMELDPSVTLEECEAMTMRQLRDRIAACDHVEAGSGQAGKGSAQGQGGESGWGRGPHRGGQGAGHGSGAGRGCSAAEAQQGEDGSE